MMTKRKHDWQYYKDLELIKRAERIRNRGYHVFLGGSVHCPENCGSIPLDDPEVEQNFYIHQPGCEFAKKESEQR